ncbi:Protein of unknown function [Lactobacillus delbrueckii subsp. bulgaricus]|nr:Protein of unknown function [Lactobacillus delbrueckii subsp. bulgaricus]
MKAKQTYKLVDQL